MDLIGVVGQRQLGLNLHFFSVPKRASAVSSRPGLHPWGDTWDVPRGGRAGFRGGGYDRGRFLRVYPGLALGFELEAEKTKLEIAKPCDCYWLWDCLGESGRGASLCIFRRFWGILAEVGGLS